MFLFVLAKIRLLLGGAKPNSQIAGMVLNGLVKKVAVSTVEYN
jgi:hypothetical protein